MSAAATVAGRPPRRWPGAAVRLLLAAALLVASPAPDAQPATATAEQVKAAFLYRFGSYVEWPPGALAADEPFVIAVAGADHIASHLEELVAEPGRTVLGHPVSVVRLRPGEPVGGVHVLFVGRDARRGFRQLRDRAADHPVLIVTELGGALERGSMIDLVIVDDRVRFDVAPATAVAHGLRISSRMLAIARIVVAE